MKLSLLVVLAAGVIGFIPSASCETRHSRIADVRIETDIQDLTLFDLNRDGIPEIVALGIAADGSAKLSSLPIGKGEVSASALQTYDLGGGVAGVELTLYPSTKEPAILRWSDNGLDASSLPAKGTKVESLNLLLPAERAVSSIKRWQSINGARFMHFFFDFKGALARLLLVPAESGFDLWRYNPAGVKYLMRLGVSERNCLRLGGSGDVAQAELTGFRPALWVTDLDGDHNQDVVCMDEERIMTFLNHNGFTGKPEQLIISHGETGTNRWEYATPRYFCLDLNHDGIPDLARSLSYITDTGIESVHEIYLGRKGGSYPPKPDYSRRLQSLSEIQGFCDFDGDGYQDMATSTINLNTQEIAESLNRGVLPFTVEIYTMEGNGYRHRALSTVKGVLTYRTLLPPHPVIGMNLDWDGDGRFDLLVPDGEAYRLYGNKDSDLFSEKTTAAIPLTPSQLLLTNDLNQDGKSDLVVVTHPDKNRSVMQILLSSAGK